MDKSFDPKDIESRWYPQWEASGYFAPSGDGEPYTNMLPPPNVTGTLHMGHAFQHTVMDTLIRYQRMCGKRALWQLGTDHAGAAGHAAGRAHQLPGPAARACAGP